MGRWYIGIGRVVLVVCCWGICGNVLVDIGALLRHQRLLHIGKASMG